MTQEILFEKYNVGWADKGSPTGHSFNYGFFIATACWASFVSPTYI